MARIVVVGDALIDEIHDELGTREFIGGAALNVAVGIARLGEDVTLVAMVGDDDAGAQIRAHLAEHGVELIATDSPHGSARAISTRVNGEPTYVFNEASQQRHIAFSDEAVAAVEAAPVVALSCVALDSAAQIAEFDRALSGARIAIDPNPRGGMLLDRDDFVAGFERVAAAAEFVKVGEDDAALLRMGSVDDLEAHLRSSGVPTVLATRGSEGATIVTSSGTFDRPIADLPGDVVDTMGAGDSMFAVFVAALAASDAPDWRRTLERAQLIAAATCRAEGALLQLP
ncbi:PfkB family carbohydrate kinase [Microbacterium halotolerans]|uniref:PfkB family carbohydrate kinase n=1 Tax=Microbacterium halotolerans TaxID=246613 RepID=UPI000E6ACE70|nr:PfkB family carbohydrate kinase [Microbacterium halotolerans]